MVRGISTAITVRRAAAIAIAGAAATALSACGAGHVTQTDTKQSAVAGVNVDKGDLVLRDLQVEFDSAEGFASGDDAALRVWIGNEGVSEVSLVGVETEVGTVTFVSPAAQAAEAAEEAREEQGEATSAEETTGDAESTDAATTEAPAAEEDALDGEVEFAEIPIAPADYIRLDQGVDGGDYFLIEDLQEDLSAGDTVTVTFRFSNDQKVTVDLPVGQPLDSESRSYYEPEEAAEGH